MNDLPDATTSELYSLVAIRRALVTKANACEAEGKLVSARQYQLEADGYTSKINAVLDRHNKQQKEAA